MNKSLHPFTVAVIQAALISAGFEPGGHEMDATTAMDIEKQALAYLHRIRDTVEGCELHQVAQAFWANRQPPRFALGLDNVIYGSL